jgi:hypothetical protein
MGLAGGALGAVVATLNGFGYKLIVQAFATKEKALFDSGTNFLLSGVGLLSGIAAFASETTYESAKFSYQSCSFLSVASSFIYTFISDKMCGLPIMIVDTANTANYLTSYIVPLIITDPIHDYFHPEIEEHTAPVPFFITSPIQDFYASMETTGEQSRVIELDWFL